MDGKPYLDGIDLTRKEFYTQLAGSAVKPATSAPGPGIFRQTYDQMAKEGASGVISIHISIKLSAMVQNAQLAAAEFNTIPLTVFDSQQLSLGTGFQVLAAARAAAEGRTMPEIITQLEELRERIYVFAALDTLEFLRRGGRMNGVMTTLGNLLQLRPIMKMYGGKPSSENTRTRAGAVKRLVELLKGIAPLEQLAIVNTHAADRGEALLDLVKEYIPNEMTLRVEVGPVVGAHTGPGVIGFVCVKKR
jgi:DegV family protein with EDD domain